MSTESTQSTDLTAYALPTADDFQSSGQQQAKRYWRTGGAKPDYPGMNDFIARPLPAMRGRQPKVRIAKHLWQLPNGKYFGHLCPVTMRTGQPCLSCEKATELARNNPLDDQLIKNMQPKEVDLFNVILRHDLERGPVIHEANWAFNKYSKDVLAQGVNSFDPRPDGFDVLIHVPRKSSGERWEYKNALRPSPLNPDPAQMQAWIEMAPDLEAEARAIPTYEQQQKQYQRLIENTSFAGGGNPQGQAAQGYTPTTQTAVTVRRASATVVSDGGSGLV